MIKTLPMRNISINTIAIFFAINAMIMNAEKRKQQYITTSSQKDY